MGEYVYIIVRGIMRYQIMEAIRLEIRYCFFLDFVIG